MKPKTILHYSALLAFFTFIAFLVFFKLIHPGLKREIVRINANIELVRYYSGQERLRAADKKGKFHTKKYDRIYISEDSMAVFSQNDYRGFLSLNTGTVVIPAVYTHAFQFSEELAVVTNERNQIGIIDRKGKLIVPFNYTYIPYVADKLADQVYCFSDGKCIITDNNFFGMVDTSGNEILPPVYQSISVLEAGLLVVKGKNKYLMSGNGKKIISDNVFNDVYQLKYLSSYSETGYSYDESEGESDSSERLCNGLTVIVTERGAGLIRNSDHLQIIPCIYDEIKAISEQLFRCQLDDSYVICDQTGKIVSPSQVIPDSSQP
jgi:hypothetical protein